ncbi:MAG: PepSY domain-containing protein [Xanthobacteraceae bacterium]
MMRALILLHRWLGVAFCLLFAMWFASGIVMHFVPFPEPSEAERLAGLGPLDLPRGLAGPAEAAKASGLAAVTRVRLTQRSDGPVYLITGPASAVALHAADLSSAAVHSHPLALAVAKDYAAHRQWSAAAARVAALKSYDQWTVAGAFDRQRPLYRIALDDERGSELYVSSNTGDVVLGTTRRQRAWNYLGSVAHWIYPTLLRSRPAAWSWVVWSISLAALIGACAGAAIGMLRLVGKAGLASPYRGWQLWHYRLGLCCALFVLTWMFSGWLSMDNGTLFSTDRPTRAEILAVAGAPDWNVVPSDELQRIGPQTIEAEWFAFAGRIYRRELTTLGTQRLADTDSPAVSERALLDAADVKAAVNKLAPSCKPVAVIDGDDSDAPAPAMPNEPIYRVVCGDVWFHVDGTSGALLNRTDSSARAYRWAFGALHRLDFPILTARPALRTILIVALCGFGFVFSLTAVVIAWRRLRSSLQPAPRQP